MINIWYLLPVYYFVYMLVSVFFSLNILFVAKRKWELASTVSFFSQFLFGLTAIMAVVVTTTTLEGGEQVAYIFSSSLMMALGAATATFSIGWFKKSKFSIEKKQMEKVILLENELKKLKEGEN